MLVQVYFSAFSFSISPEPIVRRMTWRPPWKWFLLTLTSLNSSGVLEVSATYFKATT